MRIALRRPAYRGNIGDELMLVAAKARLQEYDVDMVDSLQHGDYDAVLDCCGYAYTDAWGPENAVRFAAELDTHAHSAMSVILLPQTFGPFQSPEIREAMQRIILRADRIFTRDHLSLRLLQEMAPEKNTIRFAPDITVCLPGTPQTDVHGEHTVIVIPNKRMLDRTPASTSDAYMTCMKQCINLLLLNGLQPLLVAHDPPDIALAEELAGSVSPSIPIIRASDPVLLKGITGACRGVISSRYHGMLNALSQEIPALGTSWSHKFDALFEQYDCAECLLSPTGDEDALATAIEALADPVRYHELCITVSAAARTQRDLCDAMWHVILSSPPFTGSRPGESLPPERHISARAA